VHSSPKSHLIHDERDNDFSKALKWAPWRNPFAFLALVPWRRFFISLGAVLFTKLNQTKNDHRMSADGAKLLYRTPRRLVITV